MTEMFIKKNRYNMEIMSKIDYFTGFYFYKWISQIEFFNINSDLSINADDYFISFNYTDTLEQFYNVPQDHILHIHGEAKKIKLNEICIEHKTANGDRGYDIRSSIIRKEIQFGSVKNNWKNIEKEIVKYDNREKVNILYDQLYENMSCFFKSSYKDPQSNFEKVKLFLQGKEIDEIVIMGHSLLGVDDTYYEQIFVPYYKKCIWKIYCNDKNASEKAVDFSIKYSLSVQKIEW